MENFQPVDLVKNYLKGKSTRFLDNHFKTSKLSFLFNKTY